MPDDASALETFNTSAQGKLKSLIERIERLEEDKAAVASDLKEVYAEAKGEGFDTKIIRKVVRLRETGHRQAPGGRGPDRSLHLGHRGSVKRKPIQGRAARRPDDKARSKRAALSALRRARRAAQRAGVDLSDWEGEFLGSVEERLNTFGRAFGDPEKGAPGQALSVLQTAKLKEIAAKVLGKNRDAPGAPSARGPAPLRKLDSEESFAARWNRSPKKGLRSRTRARARGV